MATNDTDGPEPMVPDDIKERILDKSEDDENLHAIYRVGAEGNIDYYIVVATHTHDGREMLKIRYFAANQDDASDDTWMQNGITARSSDTLVERLAADLTLMVGGETEPEEATVRRDLRRFVP